MNYFACLCIFLFYFNPALCQEKNTTVTAPSAKNETQVLVNKITSKSSKTAAATTTTVKPVEKVRQKLICPDRSTPRPFFSLPCKSTKECSQLPNKNLLCCNGRCLKGAPAPPPEPIHSPTLFGLVDRVCPTDRIAELLDIQECETDSQCTPRICCPEKMPGGEIKGYCRTAEPKLDRLPAAKQFFEPLRLFVSYMQCTPPPPPILDVFPKACQNPLDCFPNLCCQEKGKKYCRPPKRSLLALVATVGQRLVPSDVARDFLNRLAP